MSISGYDSFNYKYVIITPVRDEADYIQKTIDSVTNQIVKPLQWIIVDDGSTDATPKIIAEAADRFSWIKVVNVPNRGYRKPGGGVVEAFYVGYKHVCNLKWDFIVKLDGDLSFSPDYFENCFGHFAVDSKLGIGGGIVCSYDEGNLVIDSAGDPQFHVRGATKIYRRNCWNQIHPLIEAPGWDTIDEVKANRMGWKTRTFNDLVVIQHKATGAADSRWGNWFKNGLANYITGYHPFFMVAKCIRRSLKKPFLVESLALWSGYISGYCKRVNQLTDYETIRYLRIQQLRRLMMKKSIYN